jgi:hypothetical protein
VNVKLRGVKPDSFTAIAINHDTANSIVGKAGATVTVALTPKNAIPASGSITIFVPLQEVSGSHNVENPVCTSVTGLGAALSCSYSTTSKTITVTNLQTEGEISTALSFTVSNMVNPITTAPLSGFVMKTVDADGGFIDEGNASFTVPTAYDIGFMNLISQDTK